MAEDLSGPWARGAVVTAELESEDVVTAIVQQDNLLVRIYLQVTGDTYSSEKLPVTLADFSSTVTETMETFFPVIAAELEG